MLKFKFGDKVIVTASGRKYKAVYVKSEGRGVCWVARPDIKFTQSARKSWLTPDYAGTFTLRKARGGFRYNVVGLNNEKIPTLADFMTPGEMSDMIRSQIKGANEIDKEIRSLRGYLLDNYGPFSKTKIVTGEESSRDMVEKVINHFKG